MTEHEDTFVICENMCLEPAYTKDQIDQKLESVDGVPTNVVVGFDGTTIPDGYEEFEGNLGGCEGVVSDAYDSTSTYDVGDYCIYEDELYKCITAITTPESFTSSKWEKTTVTDELIRSYRYTLTASSGTLAASGWRNIYTAATTTELEPGVYLVVITANVVGNSTGSGTGRITIDGAELQGYQRNSIPVNGAVMSTNIAGIWTVSQKKTYSINAQVYSTVSFTVQYSSYVYLIKLA